VTQGSRARAAALVSALVFGGAASPSRPAPAAPPESLRYAAAQLDCAAFSETRRSEVATYVAGRARRETVGLDGAWRFRAAPADGDSVHLEGWFDSLAVWRHSERDSLNPDTDPIIGGRFRGLLSADGRYRAEARPFVPDPLLEVADLARSLDDLLPRLPPRQPAEFALSLDVGALVIAGVVAFGVTMTVFDPEQRFVRRSR
jgi:hypothetical protein